MASQFNLYSRGDYRMSNWKKIKTNLIKVVASPGIQPRFN